MVDYSEKWRLAREKRAFVAIENGKVFYGVSIAQEGIFLGELVFNTGMCGYQEILTDPSYAGQFVCMTYPEIGNYGLNIADNESRELFLNGFLFAELNCASNWQANEEIQETLKKHKIPALTGIQTRDLTIELRKQGSLKACIVTNQEISVAEAIQRAKNWEGLEGQDYASKVSTQEITVWEESAKNTLGDVVVYDFGVKYNILRYLSSLGLRVTLVPATISVEKVLALKPDGIMLSNGPADPSSLTYAIKNTKQLLQEDIPIFGICLGHQILSLALGCECKKMSFGHHGINHPVKNLLTGKIEITSQNHNFVIDANSINEQFIQITHINLNDDSIAGITHKKKAIFSVQYHPEAGPGPTDSLYLFEQFKQNILKYKRS